MEEGRSRQRKERSDKKADPTVADPVMEPGCTLGLDGGRLTWVIGERPKRWSVTDLEDEDIGEGSAL